MSATATSRGTAGCPRVAGRRARPGPQVPDPAASPTPWSALMVTPRRIPRLAIVAIILLATIAGAVLAARPASRIADRGGVTAPRLSASAPIAARTVAATRPAGGGICSVPGIGDIGGLLGFCNLGTSGVIGGLNSLCQSGPPQPESASTGLDAIVRPPASPAPRRGAGAWHVPGARGQGGSGRGPPAGSATRPTRIPVMRADQELNFLL